MNAELIDDLRRRIEGLTARRRAALVRAEAGMWGLSVSTVYRWLKARGWRSQRKGREDRGEHRKEGLVKALDVVLAFLAKCRWETSALNAIEECERAGAIPAGLVTVSDVTRERRRREVRRRDVRRPEPHVQMRSRCPNHVHQVDVSACAQWYLEPAPDGSIRALSRRDEVYINKPRGAGAPHLLRYMLTDHCSGAFFVYYYLARGESQVNLLDFLHRAWSRKPRAEKYPFHGCPEMLIFDRGSDGAVLRNLLTGLEIEGIAHMPKNPRAKGSVESAMWWWEKSFERTTLLKPVASVAEMNLRAFKKAAWMNATRRHRRHGTSRSAYWCANLEGIRLPPALPMWKDLCHATAAQRTVTGDLMIQYRSRLYALKDLDVRVGERIEVLRSAYHPDAVMVAVGEAKRRYLIQPQALDCHGRPVGAPVYGDFKAHKKTATTVAAEYASAVPTPTPAGEWLSGIPGTFTVPKPEPSLVLPGLPPMRLSFEARQAALDQLAEALDRDPTQAEKEHVARELIHGGTEKQIAELVAAMAGTERAGIARAAGAVG